MPPKKPKQSAPSDRRHAAGLIAPGKQIQRQRSIPHLSGHAHGRPSLLPESSSSSNHDSAATPPPFLDDSNAEYSSEDMSFPSRTNGEEQGYSNTTATFRGQHGGPDQHELNGELVAGGYANGDFNPADHTSFTSPDTMTTIIGSHCRWDMLAMLLLLLQLPILPQLLVQVAFVCLIVGTDTNSWLSRRLSLGENWLKIQGGGPSLATSLVADSIAGGIFLFFRTPLQALLVDLAFAVIAICLGGGSATRDSWSESAMCSITIIMSHFFQAADRRQRVLHGFWSLLSRLSLGQTLVPLGVLGYGAGSGETATAQDISGITQDLPALSQPFWFGAFTLIRALLGIHIGTYGIIRTVRRWYENSQERTPGLRMDVRNDLELATVPGSSTPQPTQDNTVDGARNGSTDGRPPGPSPAATGHSKSTVNGRKRRKQATFVRIQQPFWAAIAQVKLTFDKDTEISQADHNGFGTGVKTQHHGEGDFRGLEGRAFVTKVEDTEIGFSAVLAASEESVGGEEERPPGRERRGSLGSKYLEFRINSLFWSSVDCKDIPPSKEHPDRCFVEGKIYGLTPLESYLVEIISSASHAVIYSASISTRPVDNSNRASAMPSQGQDSLRPLSPTTTLKTSIGTVEGKLSDHKAKSSKARRTHQNAARNLKQEVSDLSKNLQSCGSDEKQRQRQLQYRQNIKQADEAAQDFADQLAKLGDVPKGDKQTYESSKKKHKTVLERTQGLKKTLDAAKRDSDKTIQEAKNENAKVRGKREKTETRLASLVDRRKATVDENNAKRNAKVHSENQHRQRMEHLRAQEQKDRVRLQGLNTERDDTQTQLTALQQQQYFMQSSYAQTYAGQQSGAQHTPENAYSSMAPTTTRPPPGFGYMYPATATASASGNGMANARQSSLRQRHNRSSSMLSNMSSFTDDATGGAADPMDGYGIARNDSSNSGRTNSARDPASPHPKLSPIGTEVGRGSPRQVGAGARR